MLCSCMMRKATEDSPTGGRLCRSCLDRFYGAPEVERWELARRCVTCGREIERGKSCARCREAGHKARRLRL